MADQSKANLKQAGKKVKDAAKEVKDSFKGHQAADPRQFRACKQGPTNSQVTCYQPREPLALLM